MGAAQGLPGGSRVLCAVWNKRWAAMTAALHMGQVPWNTPHTLGGSVCPSRIGQGKTSLSSPRITSDLIDHIPTPVPGAGMTPGVAGTALACPQVRGSVGLEAASCGLALLRRSTRTGVNAATSGQSEAGAHPGVLSVIASLHKPKPLLHT